MKNMRHLGLTLLMVIALTLSACTVSLPSATSAAASAAVSAVAGRAVATHTIIPDLAPAAASQSVLTTDIETALQQIYETANPSVVNISVAQRIDRSALSFPSIPGLPALPQLPFRNAPSAPDEEQAPDAPPYSYGQGSGFVWDAAGHIVTNNHVVDDAERIRVTFSNGVTVPATLVGTDPASDLAVIKVAGDLPEMQAPIPVADSTQVKVGQFTVAIGNPFGLEGTMTFGIVSALGRTLPASDPLLPGGGSYTIPDIIQTDAPVNPGNSGGVLLNLNGELIGVPSAIESSTNSNAGIGFAIPSAIVAKVVPVLIEDGSYDHPWVGLSGTTLSPELAAAMGLDAQQRGALVVDVTKDSPADKAGLRGSSKQVEIDGRTVRVGGDVIFAIDDEPITRFEHLPTYLARSTEVGQTVRLTVLRDGKEVSLSLTLAARPGTEQVQERTQTQTAPADQAWLGIYGATLVPNLAGATDLEADQTGVLVQNVVSGSPADKAGLKGSFKAVMVNGQRVMVGGDVIIALDGGEIADMETLAQRIQSYNPGDKISLTLLRDGEQMQVTVTLAARPTQTP